ncbi:SDR family oxidoreductase [Natronosporangium hydrolyticum]|uniref:SDR family oxidoreductase n=1 Tax=Natronosporangium hydrolyticum TaxID=2811111 RepID=A0A895Y5C8_9ACTN|nr:UDP-glucuronic acid decarboxylase family protein [Natronosporangium hydrolyticum]QSB12904.1 SDR family oxidoreductase [Natronosporangium hydrolyticum]
MKPATVTDPGRVVVTGGAGFLGAHLCARLLADGHQVLCLDNLSASYPDSVAHLRADPRFELQVCDVTEPFAVAGPVRAVAHLAALASPRDYLDHPLASLRLGSHGTVNALELARQKGARLLLTSTSEVYGDPEQHPQPESYWGNVNPIGPRSVYDESKRFAEATAVAYHQVHRVDVGIVRIFNTFGPGMRPGDGRIVPTFASQALTGRPLTIYGDGQQTRSLCYVDDLVEGLVRMLRSSHLGPVNLGNPEELTVTEIALMIKELIGATSPLTYLPAMVDDPTRRRPEITTAQSLLGWQPQLPLREGMRRTIAWLRDSGALHGSSAPALTALA